MKVATKLAFGLYLKRLSDMKETRFKDTEIGRIPEDWTPEYKKIDKENAPLAQRNGVHTVIFLL